MLNQEILPDSTAIESILSYVHEMCIFGSTNKSKKFLLEKNNLSLFALKKQQSDMLVSPFKSLEMKRHYAVYDAITNCQMIPETQKHRESYLIGMMFMAHILPNRYGFSNCEAMAEIAFLEAIIRNFHCGIHLVRFKHSHFSEIEEINAMVLGDWPKPGCIIVSPWQGEKGLYYPWSGSCETTELLSLEYLNCPITIFSIPQEDLNNLKSFATEKLTSMNYENWLSSPDRTNTLSIIRGSFFDHINGAKYFKTKEKYLGYQDYLMLGSASKTNLNKFNAVKELLNEDEHVKRILNMATS